MKLHQGIRATRGRKSYHCFVVESTFVQLKAQWWCYKSASVLSVFKCTQKLQFSSLQLLSTTTAGGAVLCDITIVYFYTVYVSLFETKMWLKALHTHLCLFFLS